MRKLTILVCLVLGIPVLAYALDDLGYAMFENTQGRTMEVRVYRFKNVQCTNEMLDQFKIVPRKSPGEGYVFSCSSHKVTEACYTADFVGGSHSGLKVGLRCNGKTISI